MVQAVDFVFGGGVVVFALVALLIVFCAYLLAQSIGGYRSWFSRTNIVSFALLSVVLYSFFFLLPPALDSNINRFLKDQEPFFPEISETAKG